MRPGVVGLLPRHYRDITAETAARMRELGFTGCSVVIGDALEARDDELVRVGEVLRDGGITVVQCNARYEVLVHPNDERRRLGVKGLQRACECGRLLKAHNVYVRPGSVNPIGPWTPHPENFHLRTLERLVDSLRQVARAAEHEGILLALEGGSVSPLDTPERVRDVIEAVGSTALRFNSDPVNFVRNLYEAYNTTSLTNHLFDVTGPYTICAHAKDIAVADKLPIQLNEVPIGEGLMDQVTFLRRFAACCPDGYVLIEHLPDEKIPAAKAALDRFVEEAGLHWNESKRKGAKQMEH